MTTADFVAACFWPLVILFTVLLNTVRDPVLLLAQSVSWAVRGGGVPAFAAAWRAWFDGVRGSDPAASGFVPGREQA